MSNELEKKIQDLNEKVDRIELKLDRIEQLTLQMNVTLSKHISFIDETYEGLKNPINAAKRFLGR